MILETSSLGWYLGIGILLLILGLIPFLYLCFKTWQMPKETSKSDFIWFVIASIVTSIGIFLILVGINAI